MVDEATLQALADRQAITDMIYRYCRAVDRIDAELGYTIFHDDGEAHYGGVYHGGGRGLIDHICERHRGALAHTHQITNIIFKLEGDKAGTEAYFVSAFRFMQGEQLKQVTTWGRYLDQWSRRDGRWAIDKRFAVRDFDETRDILASNSIGGRRDRTDRSYQFV